MGRKPKVGGAKVERTDPAQSERFLEAARQAGVDETGQAFERAFDKVTSPKRAGPEDGAANRAMPKRMPPK